MKALDEFRSLSARQWPQADFELRRAWDAPVPTDELHRRILEGCNRSGFVREQAITNPPLDRLMSAVLALRSADWVPQVRERARTEFDRLLATGGVELWALGAEIAVRLADRRHGEWLLARIDEAVTSLPFGELRRLGPEVRRRAYRTRVLDLSTLLTTALHDHDLVVRREAAQSTVKRTKDAEFLRRLAKARTPIIRADALAALVKSGHTGDAYAALPDKHTLVRRVAQSGVRRAGDDPAAFYRTALDAEVPPEWAVAGIGETGSAADVPALRRLLRHPAPRARLAVVRALRRFNAVAVEDVGSLIDDPSRAVVREAVDALTPMAAQLDRELLVRMMAPGNPLPARIAGYRLLSAGDRWERLIASLALVDDLDPALSTLGRTETASWPRHYGATAYTAPTESQGAELARLLLNAADTLDRKLLAELRFHAFPGD